MKMKKLILISAFCFGIITFASAQQRTPAMRHQQNMQTIRIANGVRSGELTRPEAHRLAHEQQNIRMDRRQAKADGVVTRRERKHIRREQRIASRDIYRQKHDRQDRN